MYGKAACTHFATWHSCATDRHVQASNSIGSVRNLVSGFLREVNADFSAGLGDGKPQICPREYDQPMTKGLSQGRLPERLIGHSITVSGVQEFPLAFADGRNV